MDTLQQLHLAQSYLSNTKITLFTTQHTKVSSIWKFMNILPEINRLYYIREGEGWIRIRNREYYPKPGQLFLLPAGVEQSFSWINDNYFRKYWCHFTATVGEIHLFHLLNVPHYVEVADQERLENQFQELIALQSSTELTAPFRIKSLMYEIISPFIREADLNGSDGAASPSVSKINVILQYIEEHLSEQMTIEVLAKLVHLHPNYFIQVFKTMLGISPIAYINKKRMDTAQNLLLTSDYTVSDIAERMGMDPPYFSRLFKKLTGLSPSEFRQYAALRT